MCMMMPIVAVYLWYFVHVNRPLKTDSDNFYGQMAALANDDVESEEVSSRHVHVGRQV